MRKILILTILFFSFQGKAQSWCPNGAEWYHDVWNPIHPNPNAKGFIRFKYINDQIIDGIMRKVIEARFFGTLYSNPPIPHNNYYKGTYLFHENNGVIFVNNDTIYNFNANIGDKWRHPISKDQNLVNASYCNGPRGYFQVIDTGHVIINNTNLKSITLNSYAFNPSTSTITPTYVYSLTIIERIHLSNATFWSQNCPILPPYIVDGQTWGAGEQQCYKDATSFGSYSVSSPTFNCIYDFTIGLKENIKVSQLNIYPNPAKNQITIKIGELTNTTNKNVKSLYLISTLGQLYFSKEINSSTVFSIDLSNCPKGIYIIKLIDEDLKTFTQKLIVE